MSVKLFTVLNYTNSSPSKVPTKTVTIKQAEKLLLMDNNYHIRYDKDTNLLLFLDIDKVIESNTINIIINSLKQFFENEKLNISYTEAIKSDQSFSYHIVFPDHYNTVENQLTIFTNFVKQYPQLKSFVDLKIYKPPRYFRLPNQSEMSKKHIHQIIKGQMNDFLLYDFSKSKIFEIENVD